MYIAASTCMFLNLQSKSGVLSSHCFLLITHKGRPFFKRSCLGINTSNGITGSSHFAYIANQISVYTAKSFSVHGQIFEGLSGKRGYITVFDTQKVKGQQSIFVVKQAIMVEVQQLNLCTIEIHPCYLPRHKNLLLTFDLLGLSKTIIPFFHWALHF